MKEFTLKSFSAFTVTFFIVTAILTSLGACNSTNKQIVASQKEIINAYNSKNLENIKQLERVVLEERRDLAGRSLLAIGFYVKELIAKKNKTSSEKEYLENLDMFLLEAYDKASNFNLKNLVLLAMYDYSSYKENYIIFFLKKNLNDRRTHPEVKNFSLELSTKLFQQGRTQDAELANLCLKETENQDNNLVFYNALRCFLASPSYEKNRVLGVVSAKNSFQEIILEKINRGKNI